MPKVILRMVQDMVMIQQSPGSSLYSVSSLPPSEM
jgi:hypothetical protein